MNWEKTQFLLNTLYQSIFVYIHTHGVQGYDNNFANDYGGGIDKKKKKIFYVCVDFFNRGFSYADYSSYSWNSNCERVGKIYKHSYLTRSDKSS